jgi:Fic family protein
MLQPYQILSAQLLNEYQNSIPVSLLNRFMELQESELSAGNFSFYTSVAAVYSSKIEGEPIELDSYVKYKRFGVEFLPDYTKKTDDLYNAYQFAKTNPLNFQNILESHKHLAQNLLPEKRRGKIRKGNMDVTTSEGRIEYIAASPFELEEELNKFSADLILLQSKDMELHETFFFASYLHLVFVKIHPFEDGNENFTTYRKMVPCR